MILTSRFKSTCLLLLLGILIFPCFNVFAYEIESRYATIVYSSEKDLKKFNKELYMGRIKSKIRINGGDMITDEVIAKIDFIVQKVMTVLDMRLRDLKFSIVIHPNVREVRSDFKRIYKINVDYIAFYSPSRNRIFYSAKDANLQVVSHEIGHVVAENYFTISPPQRIHEVMAQFAEKHITD